jgi:hypothetical protein
LNAHANNAKHSTLIRKTGYRKNGAASKAAIANAPNATVGALIPDCAGRD